MTRSNPRGSLIIATDGLLYGTTEFGGITNGVVFQVNKNGSGYTVLHTFDYVQFENGEGGRPQCGLVQGSDGGLYGTTLVGGTNQFGNIYTPAIARGVSR